jgi:hypothetical protein
MGLFYCTHLNVTEPYDYLIWIMLLLITLHSVAISIYLFEWVRIKVLKKRTETKYVFEFMKESNKVSLEMNRKISQKKISKFFFLTFMIVGV